MDSPRHALEAVTHPDPWPWYQRLCRERPFAFDESLGLWVAAGAQAVRQALRHPGLRVRPPAEPVPAALRSTAAGEVFAQLVRMNDGEFHARHRPAVQARVQPLRLAAVADAAAASADDLAGRLPPDALCLALPVRTLARLLGVAAGALDDTTAWVQQFAAAIAPGADAAAIELGSGAALRLMAQGEAEGLAGPAAANRIALMQQSLDATAGLIATALLRLQEGTAPALHADESREAMRGFVAGLACHEPPVHNTRRFAAQALQFGGARLEQGQGLLVLLAAACRDPAAAPGGESLGFGAGAHRCPGESIAVEIAAAAVRRLRLHQGWRSRVFRCAGFRPLPNARIPLLTE